MKLVEQWQYDDHVVGRRILLYDSVSSTNSLALEAADDEGNDGLVILAGEQTEGRGQHGRTWTAPCDSSLLMSLLVFPPDELCRPALMTAWATVSVADTIRDLTGLAPTIKWPNDVLLRGKKVCGILIEQRGGVVIGIGLNLMQTREDFAAAGLPDATSLYIARRKRFTPLTVLWPLLDVLDRFYQGMCRHELTPLEQRWQEGLGLLRRYVTAECHDGEVSGTLRGLSFEGVELDLGEGAICRLSPESIRHLTPTG